MKSDSTLKKMKNPPLSQHFASDESELNDHAEMWRSLEERLPAMSCAQSFHRLVSHIAETPALDRRNFLKLMGASLALGGAAGCSRPPEHTILPYVHAPAQLTPAQPLFFATAANFGQTSIGLLVQSNMGRPTKVEGNPYHPESLGGTDIFSQACVLEVWDPDRSQTFTNRGQASTWEGFLSALGERMNRLTAADGAGLCLLTEEVQSPTLLGQIQTFLARFPAARWHRYQPIHRDHIYKGSQLAFGELLEPRYHFDQCRVVLSLEADFLAGPGVRHARDFVAGRLLQTDRPDPGRLYVVEATPTLTGAYADHRLAVRSSRIASVALAIARALGMPMGAQPLGLSASASRWIEVCANDLRQNQGRSLIVVGDAQPPEVHALAHAMNQLLGSLGTAVSYSAPVGTAPISQSESLRALTSAMAAGRVDTLFIVGGNPVYNAPVDLDFGHHLGAVGFSAHLSLYDDETSALCHWQLPQKHFLESWSDVCAFDGTVSVQQPLMAPLYGGKSAHELLAVLLGQSETEDYQIVRKHWRTAHSGVDFETFWNRALQRGVIEGTELEQKHVRPITDYLARLNVPQRPVDDQQIELIFAPDPTIWDGRYANNGWLQELPKPLTKLTWDNAALVSPSLAQRLDLKNEDVVELRYGGRSVTAPIWIMPGHADQAVTLTLGYGRTRAGHVGSGAGVNAYLLRQSDAPWFASGLEIRKTGKKHTLAVTQHHHSMEGRRPVRSTSITQFRIDPGAVTRDDPQPVTSLYDPFKYPGYAWAMSVNLDACIGCSACTIACQAENNIPIVGKTEVARGREMHWIRVDRYYKGEIDRPRTYFQPVPCMHCERAPCEAVCPVEATVHDSEGLNLQVYNRCVGTRFCSNNCPYKVRRFNFLQYSDLSDEHLKAQRNPDVTVRMRGVMEKCTYCVQRITGARIEAEKANRRLRDGEVITACQAVCPTGAIVFGDLNDPDSRINKVKRSPLSYALLAELNTRPRTTYMAKLSNPNPDLEEVQLTNWIE